MKGFYPSVFRITNFHFCSNFSLIFDFLQSGIVEIPRWHPACPSDGAGRAGLLTVMVTVMVSQDMVSNVWLASGLIKIVIITTRETPTLTPSPPAPPLSRYATIYLNFVQDQILIVITTESYQSCYVCN